MRGQGGIVTGSDIFLLTLVLGLSAIGGHGSDVGRHVVHVDAPRLLGVSLLVAFFLRPTLHRLAGMSLLALARGA